MLLVGVLVVGKVRGGKFCCTISKAKKTPERGALNPADTPAAAPAERRSRFRLTRAAVHTCSSTLDCEDDDDDPKSIDGGIHNRAMDMPTSTLGPSGPRLAPLPKVRMAAKGLRINRPACSNRVSDCVLREHWSISWTEPRKPGAKSPRAATRLTPTPPTAGKSHQ